MKREGARRSGIAPRKVTKAHVDALMASAQRMTDRLMKLSRSSPAAAQAVQSALFQVES